LGNGDVVWSPDGRLLNSTTGAPDVAIWDATTGRQVAKTSVAPEGAVIGAFSPDGAKLLVGSSTGMVHVLSVPGLRPVREPIWAGVGGIGLLAVSPNGRDAVAHGDWARIIDYSTGKLGSAIGTKEDPPQSEEFSPDGQRLAVAYGDGRLGIWDVRRGSWLAAPDATSPFGGWHLAWSADGAYVASSGAGKVAAWDGRTGAFLGAAAAPDGAVAFTEDGRILVAAADGTVRTWDPRPSAWVAAACRMAGRDLSEAEWRSYLPDRDYSPVCSP
jgi:WD40 repeat protein